MKYALPEKIFDATYDEDLSDYVVHVAIAEISNIVYIYKKVVHGDIFCASSSDKY
jgi:hypothetical protein